MGKDVLDSKRTPVNRTAALVLSQGEHFDSSKRITSGDSETPLAIVPDYLLDENQGKQLAQLVGVKVGRLTVIGYAAEQKKNKTDGARYVMRCSCGTYTYRRKKAITNAANAQIDCCEQCRHLLHLKRSEHWRRTGKDIELNSLE